MRSRTVWLMPSPLPDPSRAPPERNAVSLNPQGRQAHAGKRMSGSRVSAQNRSGIPRMDDTRPIDESTDTKPIILVAAPTTGANLEAPG